MLKSGKLGRLVGKLTGDTNRHRSNLSTEASSGRVGIDLNDLVEQLNDREVDNAIRQYLSRNFRMSELLRERSRRAARSTYDFIDANLRHAHFNADQFVVLKSRSSEIPSHSGNILDLGVYKGSSTRALARIFSGSVIHGFDSFEGLPEDWSHTIKGGFGQIKGKLPDVPENVKLYKGWFEDTLPIWVKDNSEKPISLLRVDCDIYSSTKTIFENCGPLLQPGSWVLFDELIGYYGWEDHEYKAFMEFVAATGFTYHYIAYGLTYVLLRLGERDK